MKGLVMFCTLIYKISWSFRVLEKQAKHMWLCHVFLSFPLSCFTGYFKRGYIIVYRNMNAHSISLEYQIMITIKFCHYVFQVVTTQHKDPSSANALVHQNACQNVIFLDLEITLEKLSLCAFAVKVIKGCTVTSAKTAGIRTEIFQTKKLFVFHVTAVRTWTLKREIAVIHLLENACTAFLFPWENTVSRAHMATMVMQLLQRTVLDLAVYMQLINMVSISLNT